MKIFVDIDETICENFSKEDKSLARDYAQSAPKIENIRAINQYYDEGHEITYWTARGTGTGIDWSLITKLQLQLWGAKYHHLLFGKPQYDLFIDDKNLRTQDWEMRKRCLPEV